MFKLNYRSLLSFVKHNKNKLFRVFYKALPDSECSFEYIRTIIPLQNDYLIGLEGWSEKGSKLTYIHFELLSEIRFDFCNEDQD